MGTMISLMPACGGPSVEVRQIETGPDLLAVDDPIVPIADCGCLQRGEVGARIGFAHADAPRGLSRQDLGQKLGLLIGPSVCDQRRPHLPVGEPEGGDRGACFDHLFANDQSLDCRSPAAAELRRPRHSDPSVRGHLFGELLGVAVDPRIVMAAETCDRLSGDLAGSLAQVDLLRRPREVHRCRC